MKKYPSLKTMAKQSSKSAVGARNVPIQESWYSLEAKKNYDARLALIRDLVERKNRAQPSCDQSINPRTGQFNTNDTADPCFHIHPSSYPMNNYVVNPIQFPVPPSILSNQTFINYHLPSNALACQYRNTPYYHNQGSLVCSNQCPCSYVVNSTHPCQNVCPCFQTQSMNPRYPVFNDFHHPPQLAGPGVPPWATCPGNSFYRPHTYGPVNMSVCYPNLWGQQVYTGCNCFPLPYQCPCRHHCFERKSEGPNVSTAQDVVKKPPDHEEVEAEEPVAEEEQDGKEEPDDDADEEQPDDSEGEEEWMTGRYEDDLVRSNQ